MYICTCECTRNLLNIIQLSMVWLCGHINYKYLVRSFGSERIGLDGIRNGISQCCGAYIVGIDRELLSHESSLFLNSDVYKQRLLSLAMKEKKMQRINIRPI